MLPRPVPEPIAPGQESVWDYPRPPAIRASDEQIVIVLGGVEICETTTSWRVLETSHPPTYYLPRAAFRRRRPGVRTRSLVLRVEGPGVLPATWSEATRSHRGRRWYYPQPAPAYADLRGHVAVYAAAMDRCLVDGERVVPQPGGFYGGWITSAVSGPFKGVPGRAGW